METPWSRHPPDHSWLMLWCIVVYIVNNTAAKLKNSMDALPPPIVAAVREFIATALDRDNPNNISPAQLVSILLAIQPHGDNKCTNCIFFRAGFYPVLRGWYTRREALCLPCIALSPTVCTMVDSRKWHPRVFVKVSDEKIIYARSWYHSHVDFLRNITHITRDMRDDDDRSGTPVPWRVMPVQCQP